MQPKYIDPETVRELLHYDPDTGVLTWKERGRKWFSKDRPWRSWNLKHEGKRAGSVFTGVTGYQNRRIRVLGVSYSEHRIAWVWMTGKQPPEQIDHENRDATDNRWVNLRDGTHLNSRNRNRQKNCTSGVTGVSWSRRSNKWAAKVRLSGGTHHLGYFDELDEAAMEVLEFRAEHGFDPQHGLAPAHYAQEKCARNVVRETQNG